MKTTQKLLTTQQGESIITFNAINFELASIAHTLQAANESGAMMLPGEELQRAHSLIVEAMYQIGQHIGALTVDAIIDLANDVNTHEQS